uniref:Uncharacterized protein n=1 Tax=Seriola lalandi dorsalis TaxID=1841481 RepID=A0A3B4WKI0_SERLL
SRRPMCRSRIGRHFRGGCCLLGGMHHHRINFDKYHPGEQTRVAIDKASFQSHRCYIYVFLHCCLIGSNVSDDNQCGATDKSLVYKQGNMLVWYKPQQKSHYHFLKQLGNCCQWPPEGAVRQQSAVKFCPVSQ